MLYYGVNLGRVWWRYWEILDRMKSAARFAITVTVPETLRRLQADADEIGLPPEAKKFKITRSERPPSVTITTEYNEKVELPFFHRTLVFKPSVVQRL
jgi:hypothetical protein